VFKSGDEQAAVNERSSARYFRKLEKTHKRLDEISKDCSVVLKDIKGISGVVYQDINHPDGNEENPINLDEARKTVSLFLQDTSCYECYNGLI